MKKITLVLLIILVFSIAISIAVAQEEIPEPDFAVQLWGFEAEVIVEDLNNLFIVTISFGETQGNPFVWISGDGPFPLEFEGNGIWVDFGDIEVYYPL